MNNIIEYPSEVIMLRTVYHAEKISPDQLICQLFDICTGLAERDIKGGFDFRPLANPSHSYVLDNAICETKAEGYMKEVYDEDKSIKYALTEKGKDKLDEIKHLLIPLDEEIKNVLNI